MDRHLGNNDGQRASATARAVVFAVVITLALAVPTALFGQSGDDFETRIVKAAETARRSVVAISAQYRSNGTEDSVARFSGIILDQKGHIATVAEAVERVEKLWVRFLDGKEVEARVVGFDRLTNVAVIKVAGSGFQPVEPAPDKPPFPGAFVIAVGNPFGLSHSVAVGNVSGVDRTLAGSDGRLVSGMIQTTASINPGDAGGLLADSSGRFLGMILSTFGRAPSARRIQMMFEKMFARLNSDPEMRRLIQEVAVMMFSGMGSENSEQLREKLEQLREKIEKDVPDDESGFGESRLAGSHSSTGINFAVPGWKVARIAESLVRDGRVVRGRIGLKCLSLSAYHRSKFGIPANIEGVLVADVPNDGPCSGSAISRFDVITALDGKKVSDTADFMERVYATAPGTRVTLSVWRKDSEPAEIAVTLDELK